MRFQTKKIKFVVQSDQELCDFKNLSQDFLLTLYKSFIRFSKVAKWTDLSDFFKLNFVGEGKHIIKFDFFKLYGW